MDTVGVLSPESPETVTQTYKMLRQPAEVLLREIVRAMELPADEYDKYVTDTVRKTAQQTLFASLLVVAIGDREEYASWRAEFDGSVQEIGPATVDGVVWHAFNGDAIAATFQSEPEAAVATLQRKAYGELYQEYLPSNA